MGAYKPHIFHTGSSLSLNRLALNRQIYFFLVAKVLNDHDYDDDDENVDGEEDVLNDQDLLQDLLLQSAVAAEQPSQKCRAMPGFHHHHSHHDNHQKFHLFC